jgi:hypothetical protein
MAALAEIVRTVGPEPDQPLAKESDSTYRDGSRAGWTKVKDRSWYGREAWRFDRP